MLAGLALLLAVVEAQGRPAPPGTPEAYVDQRPAPPYYKWPESAPEPFADVRECRDWFEDRAPALRRAFIGRVDVVHRRCLRTDAGWVYRETHAPVLLDPVLEPLLFVVPAAVWLDARRRVDSVAERGLERDYLDCADCPDPVEGPVGEWHAFGQVWTAMWAGLAASPLVFSRGNAKLTDAIVMAEVMAFDLGVIRGAALLRAEPRPYASSDLADWDREDAWLVTDALRGDEAWTSSPALSTSTVAASSFGLATLALLHAEQRRPVPIALVYALAIGATALQGTADVLSRRADPGDVAIGALAGATIGVLVPLSHKSISVVVDPERLARRRSK